MEKSTGIFVRSSVEFVGADAHIRPKKEKRVDVGIDPYMQAFSASVGAIHESPVDIRISPPIARWGSLATLV